MTKTHDTELKYISRETCVAYCGCEYSRRGKAVVPVVSELRETPNGGTLWFKYSNEFTANTTTPPISEDRSRNETRQ